MIMFFLVLQVTARVVKLRSFLRAIKKKKEKKEIDICSYCKTRGNEVWLDRRHVEKCYGFFCVRLF